MNGRVLLWAVVIVAGAIGLYFVREETMARERPPATMSAELVVEFRVEAKLLPSYELPTIAAAIFDTCRLQAQTGLEQPLEHLGDGRFRAVLRPVPNETDRKQLAGCLSDVTLAHTRSGGVTMYERQSDQA